ncbi:response regulator [Pedobacter rhodius]|uniref:Response regulator n=1 Tax=Pedobacter rhodius TaxID=3004098 RepID=A0ABT4KYX1_9SPHI|nr:response regulator [Pedobacter sp. SJ11]MCZ4223990.1 response regulator [Pedobacter sp. SJ11]
MSRKSILILDDDYNILDALTALFEYENYSIVTLSQLYSVDIFEDICLLKPDVILLDINFGAFNGMDLCLQLKENLQTANYKIILMSAGNYEQIAFKSKCDYYIQKPFQSSTLLAKVAQLT